MVGNWGDIPAEFQVSVRLCSHCPGWYWSTSVCLDAKRIRVWASCFNFWGWSGPWGVAGQISLGFLQDPGSDLALWQPLPVCDSVRNICRSSSAELSQASNYSSLRVSIGYSWAQGKKKKNWSRLVFLGSAVWGEICSGMVERVRQSDLSIVFLYFSLARKGVKPCGR